jgi:vitamin K-dependent gamma-carboxylase
MTEAAGRGRGGLDALSRPVSIASLSVFRALIGAVMTVGLVRYVAQGWVDTVLVEPTFFFKYPGFAWVRVFEPPGLYALFSVTALAALVVAVGALYRVGIVVFLLGFTYIQLLDVTNYLNHYYLIVLLAALLCVLPADRRYSLRVWARPEERRDQAPVWMLWLLRFQVGIVYLYAAVAKLGTDWLVHGQPMNLWMSRLNELPLLGPWIGEPWVAVAMSWAGLLYDGSIVPLLLWKRTRAWAYGLVVVFHGFTWLFFDIGMFPFIMTAATTIFFEPDWPDRLRERWIRGRPLDLPLTGTAARPLSAAGAFALGAWVLFQVAVPARHSLYPGDVLWNEEGMRYAWKVMVREKNGAVTYRVKDPKSGRVWYVSPHEYLDWRQANEMSAQPDLILQLGQHVGWDFRRRGVEEAEVYADVFVSLNGRPPARLIDPDVDLMEVEDSWRPAAWILPGPTSAPPRIRIARD